MTAEEIRKFVHPAFTPFRARTANGRQHVVRDPLSVLVGPRDLYVLDEDGDIVRLDLLDVVAVSELPATPVLPGLT